MTFYSALKRRELIDQLTVPPCNLYQDGSLNAKTARKKVFEAVTAVISQDPQKFDALLLLAIRVRA